jgi:hypothetical protein
MLAAVALMLVGPAGYDACAAAGGCCKVCKAGKACGDSCISAEKECHKGAGCACDG